MKRLILAAALLAACSDRRYEEYEPSCQTPDEQGRLRDMIVACVAAGKGSQHDLVEQCEQASRRSVCPQRKFVTVCTSGMGATCYRASP